MDMTSYTHTDDVKSMGMTYCTHTDVVTNMDMTQKIRAFHDTTRGLTITHDRPSYPVQTPVQDKSHLTRPAEHLSSLRIPRAHMTSALPPPSRLSESADVTAAAAAAAAAAAKHHRRQRPYNSFQRDLSQTVEYHRRHQSYLQAGSTSHM